MNDKNGHKTKFLSKEDHAILHDHSDLWIKRLEHHRAKLKQDLLVAKHNDIFSTHKEHGAIKEAPDSCEVEEGHYLPHCLVLKETKHDTKICMVFDPCAAGPK